MTVSIIQTITTWIERKSFIPGRSCCARGFSDPSSRLRNLVMSYVKLTLFTIPFVPSCKSKALFWSNKLLGATCNEAVFLAVSPTGHRCGSHSQVESTTQAGRSGMTPKGCVSPRRTRSQYSSGMQLLKSTDDPVALQFPSLINFKSGIILWASAMFLSLAK